MIELPGYEALFGDATLVLDKGSIDAARLVTGTQVGSASMGHGSYGDSFVIIHTGRESSGARRYLFEIKTSAETTEVEARLFLSSNAGGSGVTLEMTGGPWTTDSQAGQLFVGFTTPWYRPAAGGGLVNFQMDMRSSDWMFYQNSPLFVRRSGEIAP